MGSTQAKRRSGFPFPKWSKHEALRAGGSLQKLARAKQGNPAAKTTPLGGSRQPPKTEFGESRRTFFFRAERKRAPETCTYWEDVPHRRHPEACCFFTSRKQKQKGGGKKRKRKCKWRSTWGELEQGRKWSRRVRPLCVPFTRDTFGPMLSPRCMCM